MATMKNFIPFSEEQLATLGHAVCEMVPLPAGFAWVRLGEGPVDVAVAHSQAPGDAPPPIARTGARR
jgi:hypothetical protein